MYIFTISLSIDGALVEAHDILSESSSLVTEDVFNLKNKGIKMVPIESYFNCKLHIKNKIKPGFGNTVFICRMTTALPDQLSTIVLEKIPAHLRSMQITLFCVLSVYQTFIRA